MPRLKAVIRQRNDPSNDFIADIDNVEHEKRREQKGQSIQYKNLTFKIDRTQRNWLKR